MRRRVLSLGLSLWASATGAQDVTDLERVTVVGSRLPRVNAETSLPVQIIRREDIERSGVTTIEEVLARVSASSTAFLKRSASATPTRPVSLGRRRCAAWEPGRRWCC